MCRGSNAEATTSVGNFELIDRAGIDVARASRTGARGPPLSKEEWVAFFNAEGEF